MTTAAHTQRVLSVQSHVVHGYVGNKCAIFPLQLLGFDVDPIMSVHLSNHTGYPIRTGTVMDGSQLQELTRGLSQNGLLQYSHLLTGYIGSASFLLQVVDLLKCMRKENPQLCYVCDPVLGDEGRLYVPQELVQVYRDQVLAIADVLTPNQFELELLTGTSLSSKADVFSACEALHDRGVHTVVVTSSSCASAADIVLLASTRQPQEDGCPSRFSVSVPRLDAYFTGTGDLLAALLLARVTQHPGRLAVAVEAAVASLHAVLKDTAEHAGDAMQATTRSAAVCRRRELRLVQNQHSIAHPVVQFKAVREE